MKKSVSTAVAGVALALTTSTLALVLPATSAHAASAACTTATSNASKAATARTSAATALTKAKKASTTAKKAQKKAKKAAVAAKKAAKKKATKATKAKVKKTTKKLVAANKRVKTTTATVKRATATYNARSSAASKAASSKASVCKTGAIVTPNNPETQALTAVLQLILNNLDAQGAGVLGTDGVKGILNSVAPELGDLVSDDILGTIVAALRGPIKSATEASQMFQDAFGTYLDPDVLSAMAAGGFASLSNQDFISTFTKLSKAFSDAFNVDGLGSLNATQVTAMLAQFQNMANPDLLKNLSLDSFTGILSGLASGDITKLSKPQLTQLTSALNAAKSAGLPGLDTLKSLPLLGDLLGGLTNGAGGLPKISDIPVLGSILSGLLGGLIGCGGLIPLCLV